ncbi:MAG: SEC-C domain-containing protein [Deltaproteobacteria bacterium]|nr:SEC-C domain-containing protein [Deltaproteobacteria bacterium]
MAKKLGRNAPCWCGSGIKYKKCHLNRESEQRLPAEAIYNEAKAAWDHKECLHPLAGMGICDKIVSAHTVQRSGVLQRIIDSTNHVRTFYPIRKDNSGRPILRCVGWRKASTFTGFCAKHDSEIFTALEKKLFTGTDEQCFLVGYRALCHEVYQKSGSLRAGQVIRQSIDRGLPEKFQRQIQGIETSKDAGTRKGLADFQRLKGIMDRHLLEKDYSGWSRAVITFRGDLCVASTGAVSPNRDLEGHKLQGLHDTHTHQESLLYGVVPVPEGGAVVMTWLSRETAPRLFVNSLLKEGNRRLPSLLVQFMFAYVENTYFSGAWWESLNIADRQHIELLAGLSNAYYTYFDYSLSQIVPWEVMEVARITVDDSV